MVGKAAWVIVVPACVRGVAIQAVYIMVDQEAERGGRNQGQV